MIQEQHRIQEAHREQTREKPGGPEKRGGPGRIRRRRHVLFCLGVATLLAVTGDLGWQHQATVSSTARLTGIHAPQGLSRRPMAAARVGTVPTHALPTPPDPVQPARDAYNQGHYLQAEAAARQVIVQDGQSQDLGRRKAAVRARSLMAYAAARRRNLPLARTRFALLQREAAALPDRGKPEVKPGEDPPTLEEDAAYQHAVCTGALGNKAAAEGEYLAFLRRYPESPLVSGVVGRIARLHGGNIPPVAEAAWQQAQKTAQAREKARERKAILCGPECLAELLRREGRPADIHALARELGTGERGTTLAALATALQKRGYLPQGLALTQKGLAAQKLPVVALIMPGHYVLVEGIAPTGVTVWDPDARGLNRGDRRMIPLRQWQFLWHGVALALRPSAPGIQTAQR